MKNLLQTGCALLSLAVLAAVIAGLRRTDEAILTMNVLMAEEIQRLRADVDRLKAAEKVGP